MRTARDGKGRRVVGLVSAREIRERLRTKSYLAMTALVVLVVLAIGVIARVAGDEGPGALDVGVVGPASQELSGALEASGSLLDREVAPIPIADGEAGRSALVDGEIDLLVDTQASEIVFEEDVDEQLAAAVQQVWATDRVRQGLLDAGLSPSQVSELLSPDPLEIVTLEGDDDDTLAMLTGTLVSVMLFLSLQTFGSYVLVGVVEEKSTAVVELLLARVRSDQLLAGKVIGIGTTALLQFVAAVAAGIAALLISGTDVPGAIWSSLPVAIVWFLGGYALYSTLFALAGSLVSRQEDAQAAAAPITTVLIAAYLLVFILGADPESTASRIISLIPPLAPFLMPMRMAAGAASIVEVVVSLLLLATFIVLVWRLAGRIYAQVLLRRGSRIGWADAASLLRGG